jgi:hypothetical protein
MKCVIEGERNNKENWNKRIKKTGKKGRSGELRRVKKQERKKVGSVARYVTAKTNHFLFVSSSINVSEDVC